ncbi:hypothetical protein N7G274_001318 [Stereocaulon virgatum]|uniref:Uncharacterized protein n=1 Tax=Stereocaulon virgatum TaxID=373712 RepID=A0ABR4AQ95_9LECA
MAAASSTTLTALAPISPTSISSITTTLISSAATSTVTTSLASAPSTSPNPNAGIYILLLPPCHAWSCWTPAEHHTIIVFATLLGILLIAVLIYVCIMHRKRKRRMWELERGPGFEEGDASGKGKGSVGFWWREKRNRMGGGIGKGKGKVRVGSRSMDRRRSQSRPKGIEGLESIELGPAATRTLFESGGGGLGTSRGVGSVAEGILQEGRREGGDRGARGQEMRSSMIFEMD